MPRDRQPGASECPDDGRHERSTPDQRRRTTTPPASGTGSRSRIAPNEPGRGARRPPGGQRGPPAVPVAVPEKDRRTASRSVRRAASSTASRSPSAHSGLVAGPRPAPPRGSAEASRRPRSPPRRWRRVRSPVDRAARSGPGAGRRAAGWWRPSPPSCGRRPGGLPRSSPVVRMNATRSAAVSRNRARPVQWPVWPCPGRSTATTRRPVAASAGPTRHQMAAEAVTPWTSRRGRADGSPQANAENGIPAASTVIAHRRVVGSSIGSATLAHRRTARIERSQSSGGSHGQPVRRPAQERARRHGQTSPRRSRRAASTCGRSAAAASATPAT